VEIVSVGSASKLKKEHPEWVMTRNGQPIAGGRNLDFANPAVVAWAEAEIARIISKYDLDMFRLDYNTGIFEGGNRVNEGFVENTQWEYVQALYSMFDRLRKKFPNVTFQNCASGGGRLDYGILQRFDNTELSDWSRSPRTLKILNGMTWILPPEIILLTFGTETGGLEADGDVDLQLRRVFMGLPIFRGISPSVSELDPVLANNIRRGLELYKQNLRSIMIGSRVYHHTPVLPLLSASPWLVLEYAASAGDRDTIALFRTAQSGDPVYRIVPEGLDYSRNFVVRFGNSGQVLRMLGSQIKQEGISVRLDENLTSEMLTFTASQ
jgi:alpha-galactosidase